MALNECSKVWLDPNEINEIFTANCRTLMGVKSIKYKFLHLNRRYGKLFSLLMRICLFALGIEATFPPNFREVAERIFKRLLKSHVLNGIKTSSCYVGIPVD
ncbi:hypothetical protein EPI10_004958 [Gossypium australe]|uniref:Uncharacterized protein n=1 Tax=Gossypium australe TaxID=47621 RepID=A0A5B6WP19_9ROSI|nr:hypothetical protein EPI10_004958 [Gossypium australe]